MRDLRRNIEHRNIRTSNIEGKRRPEAGGVRGTAQVMRARTDDVSPRMNVLTNAGHAT